MDVSNKVVFITGGLGGIGQAIVKQLLKEGVKGVTIVDLDLSNQASFLRKLKPEFSNKVLIIQTNITKEDEIVYALDKTIEHFDALDIVINNAGIFNSNWEKEVEVNYKGTYRIMQLAMRKYLPKYKSGFEGIIVNNASLAGVISIPISINYAATKAAVVALGRSYSNKYFYDKYKVKILTICPGSTPHTNIGIKNNFTLRNIQWGIRMKQQSSKAVGKRTVEAIKEFDNGDVYIIDGSKKYKHIFPHRTESMSLQEKI